MASKMQNVCLTRPGSKNYLTFAASGSDYCDLLDEMEAAEGSWHPSLSDIGILSTLPIDGLPMVEVKTPFPNPVLIQNKLIVSGRMSDFRYVRVNFPFDYTVLCRTSLADQAVLTAATYRNASPETLDRMIRVVSSTAVLDEVAIRRFEQRRRKTMYNMCHLPIYCAQEIDTAIKGIDHVLNGSEEEESDFEDDEDDRADRVRMMQEARKEEAKYVYGPPEPEEEKPKSAEEKAFILAQHLMKQEAKLMKRVKTVVTEPVQAGVTECDGESVGSLDSETVEFILDREITKYEPEIGTEETRETSWTRPTGQSAGRKRGRGELSTAKVEEIAPVQSAKRVKMERGVFGRIVGWFGF